MWLNLPNIWNSGKKSERDPIEMSDWTISISGVDWSNRSIDDVGWFENRVEMKSENDRLQFPSNGTLWHIYAWMKMIIEIKHKHTHTERHEYIEWCNGPFTVVCRFCVCSCIRSYLLDDSLWFDEEVFGSMMYVMYVWLAFIRFVCLSSV